MMMTQEQALLKARKLLQAIETYVDEAAGRGERINNVERELFSQLLLLGQKLLQSFVAAQGDGNAGPTCQQEGPVIYTQLRNIV